MVFKGQWSRNIGTCDFTDATNSLSDRYYSPILQTRKERLREGNDLPQITQL